MHLQSRLSILVVLAALVSMATGCATSTDTEEPPVKVERNAEAEKDPPPPAAISDSTSTPNMRAVCRWMTCSDVGGEQGYRCWVCY